MRVETSEFILLHYENEKMCTKYFISFETGICALKHAFPNGKKREKSPSFSSPQYNNFGLNAYF